jgi:hypothetical protein
VAKGADCKSAASWLRRFESFLPHQPSLASRAPARRASPAFSERASEGCRAVARRAQAGFAPQALRGAATQEPLRSKRVAQAARKRSRDRSRIQPKTPPAHDRPHPDHVEMRKLESLSNTIFGVISFRLGHLRHFQARKIPEDRAYLIHRARIGAAQVARGFDRGFFGCAIHKV